MRKTFLSCLFTVLYQILWLAFIKPHILEVKYVFQRWQFSSGHKFGWFFVVMVHNVRKDNSVLGFTISFIRNSVGLVSDLKIWTLEWGIVRSHVLNLFSFNSEIQKKRKFEIVKRAPTSCKSKEIKTMHLPKEKRAKRPAIFDKHYT
jgi:hypothetical protein